MKMLLLTSLLACFFASSASANPMSKEFVFQKSINNQNSLVSSLINELKQSKLPSNSEQTKDFDPFDFRPGLCQGIPNGVWVGPCQCGFGQIIVCHQL